MTAGETSNSTKKGSLIVAGTGIKSIAHLTVEAQAWIREADIVLHCLADPVTALWVRDNSKQAIDLNGFYQDSQPRLQTYLNMSAFIMQHVRAEQDVCVVFYGHPGIFAMATHYSIAMARAEGYRTAMLPGISAEDCLFAELGFDPATYGCQSLEATDMLLRRRAPQIDEHVIIWQAGEVGNLVYHERREANPAIAVLLEYLLQFYPPEHPVFHYQGAQYPISESAIEYLSLSDLVNAHLSTVSTLYLPPVQERPVDKEMAEKLGIVVAEGGDVATSQTDNSPPSSIEVPPSKEPLPPVSGLSAFMEILANQPQALAEFRREPNLAVKLYGELDGAETRTVLTGEASDIRRAVLTGQTGHIPIQRLFTQQEASNETTAEEQTVAAKLFTQWCQSPEQASSYAEAAKQTQAGALPQNLTAHLQDAGCILSPQLLYAALPKLADNASTTAHYVHQVIQIGAILYAGQVPTEAFWLSLARLKADIKEIDSGLSSAAPHPHISQRDKAE
ncbi:MAG: SAM-dependent methyltransferase [Pseudomonadota bacterium]